MHRRRILPLSLATWLIGAPVDVVTTAEGGPALPNQIHNLLLAVLITVTTIGAIFWSQSSDKGGYSDGYSDGFVDGTSGRRPHLRSVDGPPSDS